MCCTMKHLLILDTPKAKEDMETSIKGTKFVPDAQRGRKIAIGKGPEKERKRQTERDRHALFLLGSRGVKSDKI